VIRVCHIISGDLWAGAEVVACHLLQELLKYDDLEITAILLNDGRLADELRKSGISLFVVDEKKRSMLQIYLDIRKIMLMRHTDIIHSHRYKENILAYLASKREKNIRLVATQHGMPEMFEGNGKLKPKLISWLNFFLLSRSFKNVVTVSQDMQKTFVQDYGFKESKVVVIHNGIEIHMTSQRTRRRSDFVVGSSGRFFPVKDYPLMVEIARTVLEKVNDVCFELAGDGPERPKIQCLIRKYGLEEKFVLRGFVDDISHFYQGIDLYLCTSLHEGIPMSVLEAMAHGLPVIAPKVGGLEEILEDGVEGYLVEGRNPIDYAEKCIKILVNGDMRDKMRMAARDKVAKDFSINHMAQKYYQLYRNMTNS
jgi:glycosyltransferase involved in cell wall biosynthesis